jgi:hypothetical protein
MLFITLPTFSFLGSCGSSKTTQQKARQGVGDQNFNLGKVICFSKENMEPKSLLSMGPN